MIVESIGLVDILVTKKCKKKDDTGYAILLQLTTVTLQLLSTTADVKPN